MGNLSNLLAEIKAGTIPEGTLYKRKNSTRRSPKGKTQIRIAPVDAALAEVKKGLGEAGEYRVPGSPKGVTLTPEQYEEVVKPFRPYLDTLDNAQIVVSAIKHGRIEYDGGLDERHSVKLPIKPWPRHRKTPHMERIIALKRQLYGALQFAESGYQRWKTKNQKMKTEISDEISQLEKSASATKKDYDILVRTYEALQSSMATPNDNWYVAAAQTLGCDGRLDVILNKLEQSETSLRTSVVRVKRGFEAIRQTLEVQIKALDTGDYILTSEDIGSEPEKGLQGRLGESLAQIEWYKEPKRSLFEGGVTPASPQKSGMIKALHAVITIEEITNNVVIFKSQYEQLIGDLNQAHFLGRYALDFNPNTEREKAETAFADVKGHEELKRYYLDKLSGFDKLKTRAQQAYDAGCDKLRKEATGYLGITRVELEEVQTTMRGIEKLCNQIKAARKFSYRGITATKVIDEERLTQLKDFRDVLERAQTGLDSTPTPRESHLSMYLSDFDYYYRRAEGSRRYGVDDSEFVSSVKNARYYTDTILQRASPQTEKPPIDSRVDHLFQQQVRTSPIPDEKLEQLKRWEGEIQAAHY